MGLTLGQLLGWSGPLTHRQLRAWVAWTEEEWNRPSRSDWYLMQLAACWAGGRVDKYKLSFSPTEPAERRSISVEEESAWAQARWFARMTMPVKIVRPTDGNHTD